MKRFLPLFTLMLLLPVLSTPARADSTVVSVSGPLADYAGMFTAAPTATPPTLGSIETNIAAWSQSSSYSNVTVAAMLDGNSYNEAFSGQAFLMTQVGPGTTTASQVAAVDYSVAANASGLVNLFSGLNLGPGNYYLVIDVTSGAGAWDGSAVPATIATGTGVTFLGSGSNFDSFKYGSTPPYIPTFNTNYGTNGNQLEFQVTSLGSTTTPTPEPGTFLLISAGGLVFAGLQLSRRVGIA
ncbi:MAG TPA: hypothetical protein VFC10_18440 [Terriglobia bacterium]|jgi:hypothetical protein|nr:hypothetical protein [Terriglobia bacterium]